MKHLIVFVALLVPFFVHAQPQSKTAKVGKATYVQDARLDDLYALFLDEEKDNPVITGYRIQISSGTNRNNVNQVKTEFYTKFPEERPYITYQQPNFKLRVGNYRTKLDAYRKWLEVREHFTDAFIIRDELNTQDL